MKFNDFMDDFKHHVYYKGIRRLIPTYHNRTIFTAFYWRTLRDRRKLGFDETETWSLDYSLAKLIAPRISMFIEYGPKVSLPTKFLDTEYKKSMVKGYEWDNQKWQLKDKAERNRCWNRATKAWLEVLNKIKDGFEDVILEEEDWDAWNNKWKSKVDAINKKLNNAKTEEQRKEIWNSLNSGYEYRSGNLCHSDDIVYNMRKEARFLLAEYYHSLWW